MDHDGFMTGMLLGGALVALVPTALVIGVAVYVVRQQRANRMKEPESAQTREVSS